MPDTHRNIGVAEQIQGQRRARCNNFTNNYRWPWGNFDINWIVYYACNSLQPAAHLQPNHPVRACNSSHSCNSRSGLPEMHVRRAGCIVGSYYSHRGLARQVCVYCGWDPNARQLHKYSYGDGCFCMWVLVWIEFESSWCKSYLQML